MKDGVVNTVNNVKNGVVTAWNNVKTGVTTAVNNIKTSVVSVWNGIKTTVTSIVSGIVSSITSKFNSARATVTGAFNLIKSGITNAINGARDAVDKAIEKIKGFFNFEFSWPKLPLPHFTITPQGWVVGDLLKGTIPKLSVSWYKRAYDNPMMFTRPTVMQTPQGMKGFGDGHGAEIVLGLNKLRELVATSAGDNIVINVYPPQGASVDQIARAVEQKLTAAQQRRMRVYA